ncbi:MCE family protein [Rhodococcus sp. CX]|uniref:MCE family protein n=1 Tax=Rhodococcus sp. CX TaxID=2789880 RepID=UPI0018CF1250|nr:MlaD family protein [Rhodococcus sp. CX]MBH0119305.1 MCE family protein [Rhodococcus sp. CX]
MMPSVRNRLIVFLTVGIAAIVAVGVWFVQVPAQLGIGRYVVRLDLADAGGLYPTANVTYRGVTIGRVTEVRMTDDGAEATLSLDSSVPVPASTAAEIRSMSAIGERYVDLVPDDANTPYLADGDVLPRDRVTLPEPVDRAIDRLDDTLQAVGADRLAVLLDEAHTAIGASGDDLRTLVDSATAVAGEGADNADETGALIDGAGPLLQTQIDSSSAIGQWASALAGTTGTLRDADPAVRALVDRAAPAADEVSAGFQRIEPTLPLLLANLVSVEQVAAVYNPGVEQILVLFPSIMASTQSAALPNVDNPSQNTFFVNSYNDPPPCIEGFLPPEQRRSPTELDVPETPPDLYCKLPSDDPVAVRGARNLPCLEFPGLRGATVQTCREQAAEQGVAGAVAGTYDPITGVYTGSDGKRYVQGDLAGGAPRTLEDLLLPTG